MKYSPAEGSDTTGEAAAEEILYSAEVRRVEGVYKLVINDHLCGDEEIYAVPPKAVKRLPFYLSMLRSKLS